MIRMMQLEWYFLLHIVLAHGVPIVDPGLFVITGVSSCRSGSGYCLLGLDCTLDEDFIHDNEGGHCKGLRSAFTPSAHFVCCRYSKEEFDNLSVTIEDISTSHFEYTTQANYIDYATDHLNNTGVTENNVNSTSNPNNTHVSNNTKHEPNITLYKTNVTGIINSTDQITLVSLIPGSNNVSMVNASNNIKYADIRRRVSDDRVIQKHKNNATKHDFNNKTTNLSSSIAHSKFEESLSLSTSNSTRLGTKNPYKNHSDVRLSLESLQSVPLTHSPKKENAEKMKPDPLAFLKRNFTLMDFKFSPQIHPCWMVHFLDSRTSDRLCVGGRVTSDLIITTAECAISLYVSGMENILSISTEEEYDEIYSISIHEEYKNHDHQESENNIAMVKLSTKNAIGQQCLLSLAEPRQKFLRKTCHTVISDSTDFYMERSQYCNGVVESQLSRLSIYCPKMADDEMRIIEGSPLICGNVLAGLTTNSSQKFINFLPISSYVTWILKYS